MLSVLWVLFICANVHLTEKDNLEHCIYGIHSVVSGRCFNEWKIWEELKAKSDVVSWALAGWYPSLKCDGFCISTSFRKIRRRNDELTVSTIYSTGIFSMLCFFIFPPSVWVGLLLLELVQKVLCQWESEWYIELNV